MPKTQPTGATTSKMLYIGNLPQSITENRLASLLSAYGTVLNVRFARDIDTKKPLDYAFITMDTYNSYTKAYQNLNGKYIDEKYLVAKIVEKTG